MSKVDRKASILKLKQRQARIEPESEDDEGAAEYFGEIQSVIDVLENPQSTDAQIIDAANYVSEPVVLEGVS